MNESLYPDSQIEQKSTTSARESKRKRTFSSQFEWAVQNFEAGDYEKAIPQFEKLRAIGPELSGYEQIPFYLGMSHFYLSENERAKAELEAFLRSSPANSEGQDARIALLSLYERQKNWDRVLGLAAETDKLTLFQDKRAFLKLVWARALREKGESKGARAVLQDSSQYLDGHSIKRNNTADLDRDLWGRYHYTSFLLDTEVCEMNPKEIGKGKAVKRLYETWLDASVDCYRQALDRIAKDLFDSGWANPAFEFLEGETARFGEKIKAYIAKEKPRLNVQRELEAAARRHLYRLLTAVDEKIKLFKNQGLNIDFLVKQRKFLDLLLVSLRHSS